MPSDRIFDRKRLIEFFAVPVYCYRIFLKHLRILLLNWQEKAHTYSHKPYQKVREIQKWGKHVKHFCGAENITEERQSNFVVIFFCCYLVIFYKQLYNFLRYRYNNRQIYNIIIIQTKPLWFYLYGSCVTHYTLVFKEKNDEEFNFLFYISFFFLFSIVSSYLNRFPFYFYSFVTFCLFVIINQSKKHHVIVRVVTSDYFWIAYAIN